MKVLITSGGCKVPIDDVRHIGNFSSGRYGAELAEKFFDKGNNDVIFFMEKGSKVPFNWRDDWIGSQGLNSTISMYEYKNYDDYLSVKDVIKREQPDIIISAAAISDYIVDKIEGKISSSEDELVIRLRKGEKVIKSFRELAPNAVIVGFKLLVGPTEVQKYDAIKKVFESGVDVVVYNDLSKLREGDSTREFFGKHLGDQLDQLDYTAKDIHICKTPEDLVKFINRYLEYCELKNSFEI